MDAGPGVLQSLHGGNVVMREMTLTMSEVNRAAGPQMYVFQDIQMRFRVHISVQTVPGGSLTDPLNKLVVRGNMDGVQNAMKAIYQVLASSVQQAQTAQAGHYGGYGANATYGAPSYGTPSYGTPAYGTPAYGTAASSLYGGLGGSLPHAPAQQGHGTYGVIGGYRR